MPKSVKLEFWGRLFQESHLTWMVFSVCPRDPKNTLVLSCKLQSVVFCKLLSIMWGGGGIFVPR